MKYRKVIAGVFVLFALSVIVVLVQPRPIEPAKTIPSGTSKFILASWDYPDEYGQGIEVLWIWENSTGAWEPVLDPAYIFWNESPDIEVNATGNNAVMIGASVNINHTLWGLGPDKANNASARAMMRVSIKVEVASNVVFSQGNMTWDGTCFDDTPTTWAISYNATVNVLLVAGTTYTATITYEVFC